MNDPLDDLLDARLRDGMSYIDDTGFTAQVLQQLPARPTSLRQQRSIIIVVAAILSVIVAYFASGQGLFLRDVLVRAINLSPIGMVILALALGSSFMAGGLWAALHRTRDPLS